jgi:hypothetical protein
VRWGSFGRLVGPWQPPGKGWQGEEQGPEGKGHTFESCGVPQKGISGRVETVAGSSIPRGSFRIFTLVRPPGDAARAPFRSCCRFLICLHRQTGAGIAPYPTTETKASDAWRLFHFIRRVLRLESNISP